MIHSARILCAARYVHIANKLSHVIAAACKQASGGSANALMNKLAGEKWKINGRLQYAPIVPGVTPWDVEGDTTKRYDYDEYMDGAIHSEAIKYRISDPEQIYEITQEFLTQFIPKLREYIQKRLDEHDITTPEGLRSFQEKLRNNFSTSASNYVISLMRDQKNRLERESDSGDFATSGGPSVFERTPGNHEDADTRYLRDAAQNARFLKDLKEYADGVSVKTSKAIRTLVNLMRDGYLKGDVSPDLRDQIQGAIKRVIPGFLKRNPVYEDNLVSFLKQYARDVKKTNQEDPFKGNVSLSLRNQEQKNAWEFLKRLEEGPLEGRTWRKSYGDYSLDVLVETLNKWGYTVDVAWLPNLSEEEISDIRNNSGTAFRSKIYTLVKKPLRSQIA